MLLISTNFSIHLKINSWYGKKKDPQEYSLFFSWSKTGSEVGFLFLIYAICSWGFIFSPYHTTLNVCTVNFLTHTISFIERHFK